MNKRIKIIDEIDSKVLEISKEIAECFVKYFPSLEVFVVNDILGEDHIYARDENKKPMFDLLISSARKFVFLWYYIHPSKGMDMVQAMKDIVLRNNRDFAVKFPNIPTKKPGYPAIIRYGKKPAGVALKDFIIKAGNPQLEEKIYTEKNLNTYRNYNWQEVPNHFKKILDKAEDMLINKLAKKHPDKIKNIRGYYLYAGCAYHYVYPHLGFGMRDIDVEALFSPDWYTNTRCAYTRHCDIEEFGTPEYFNGETRWLDLMYNTLHSETGDIDADLVTYLNEMRCKSDRWATMSQRPFINLETGVVVYMPKWLTRLNAVITL
jgi:hypothetical protein